METTTLTLRIPTEMKERLDKLADATHRSKSYLAGEALRPIYSTLKRGRSGKFSRHSKKPMPMISPLMRISMQW